MKLRLTNKESIRSITNPAINAMIDKKIEENIRRYTYAGSFEISERIKELENEWDIERFLRLNAASLAISGIILSFKSKSWLLLSAAVLAFNIFHAIKGWSPLVVLLRRLGIRSKQEIECELYAMKILRGDFTAFQPAGKRDADIAIKEAMIAVGS
jgi:hypothetical protein